MSYSKNGFLATGSGGGSGASATIVPSSRQIVVDDCGTLAVPANITTSGSLALDGTRLARVFTGSTSYQTAAFNFNEFATIEVLAQRISTVASGEFQMHLKRASDNVSVGYVSLQSDGNIVVYATAATGSGVIAAQGDRYKININYNGSTVDAIVRRGSFSDYAGSTPLNQTGYASTNIPDGTSVYAQFVTTGTAQFAVHGIRVFNGPATYGANTLSGAVAPGVTYASPSISMPQGLLVRQYTFDSDANNFTVDTGGTVSSVGGQLRVTKTAAANATVLEPAAGNVADGEFTFDYMGVVTSTQVNGSDIFGPVFRATDANNHYMIQINTGIPTINQSQIQLYKKVAGTYTALVSTPQTQTAYMPLINRDGPHRFMVRFVGPLISLYVNETFLLSWYDSTFTTGRVGLYVYNIGTYNFDNLTAYSLASTWTALPYTPQSGAAAPQYQIPTAAQINYIEVTSASGGTLTNQTWSTINLDTIVTDPNGLYNTTTKQYSVPVTGTYLINMQFRSDAAAGANVGFAVHTSNIDSVATVWRQDNTGTGNRHTYNYTRVAKFNAGDLLRAFAYVDVAGTTVHNSAGMTIQQVATSGAVASAAALPETVSTVASASGAYAIPDPTVASIVALTLTGALTPTFPSAGAGKSFTLALTQDATGSRTVTWPGTVKWPGGAAPNLSTAAGKTDLLSFVCVDGTNWLGALSGKY